MSDFKRKSFRCLWSAEVFHTKDGQDKLEENGMNFFSDDLGYGIDDLEAIQTLNVGEVWHSPDYGHAHTVTRIS